MGGRGSDNGCDRRKPRLHFKGNEGGVKYGVIYYCANRRHETYKEYRRPLLIAVLHRFGRSCIALADEPFRSFVKRFLLFVGSADR